MNQFFFHTSIDEISVYIKRWKNRCQESRQDRLPCRSIRFFFRAISHLLLNRLLCRWLVNCYADRLACWLSWATSEQLDQLLQLTGALIHSLRTMRGTHLTAVTLRAQDSIRTRCLSGVSLTWARCTPLSNHYLLHGGDFWLQLCT